MAKVKVAGKEKQETEAVDIYSDIRSMSITPTTFNERSYSVAFEDVVFKETYSHSDIQVVRFCINAKTIPDRELTALSPSASVSSGVSSSGKSGSAYSKNEANAVIHHKAEIEALQNAINYLFEIEAPHRTAVVDILVRNKGVIKIPAEVHSITLYKNPADALGKSDLVVIDPSNFLYSSHLSNPDVKSHVKHENFASIITLHKSLQIYKSLGNDSVGPELDQYRDCVDIAVKLAFNLSRATHSIDLKSIENETLLIQLSNTGLDTTFPEVTATIRIKQSSDVNHVNKFYELENSLGKKIVLLNFNKNQANYRLEAYADLAIEPARGLDSGTLHAKMDSIRIEKKDTNEGRYKGIIDKAESLISKVNVQFKVIEGHDTYLEALNLVDTEISGEIIKFYSTLDL